MDHSLLQSLFDDVESGPLTVSELNSDIRATLEQRFSNVWVEGEITNFVSASSGHWYFSLSDDRSLIKAACFRGTNYRIRFKPFDGLQVRVRGQITTYERRGEYQLAVESLEPVGEGALTVAFEQIKSKLAKEGLFDQALKRPIPRFPRRIGVITSPTGAAVHDILSVLDRRARSVHIVLIPTLVQGELASGQIARAIEAANEYCDSCLDDEQIDVLIVGRGGGSAEDLWAFNEEIVARAIRGSRIPVISAVGHEIDLTIADMAADLRAPTPSAAAEVVAQAEEDILTSLARSTERLVNIIEFRLLSVRSRLERSAFSPAIGEFPARVSDLLKRVELLDSDLGDAVQATVRSAFERLSEQLARLAPIRLSARVARNANAYSLLDQRRLRVGAELTGNRSRKLENLMGRLDALSPLAVLTRGYSLTQKQRGQIVRNSHLTQVGELLKIRFAEGSVNAEVKEVLEV
ncbi:MAG: exodeoxyribonuclease VII large subunit [Pyrinomonadaceae bacterium]